MVIDLKDVKAVIFDLDGVLVDTAKYHFLAWKRLADELGFVFTEQDNERLKGVSRVRSLEILLEVGNMDFDEDIKLKLMEKKNNWYVEYISKMDESELLPGVKQFILDLKEKGIKTAIGSASKNTPMILKNVGIYDLFDAIVDGNSVSKAKPDPEVFLKGAELLQVSPKDCLVFEDAFAGLEAAKNAGMKCIGVGKKQILYIADSVISGFDNI